jgi:hypothetical protein
MLSASLVGISIEPSLITGTQTYAARPFFLAESSNNEFCSLLVPLDEYVLQDSVTSSPEMPLELILSAAFVLKVK